MNEGKSRKSVLPCVSSTHEGLGFICQIATSLTQTELINESIYMEMVEQIFKRGLDSAYLQEQTEAFTNVCKSLWEIDRGAHLTTLQRLVMRHALEIIGEITEQHRRALKALETSEREASFFAEKAKALLALKSSSLNTAGRVALVAYEYPYLLKRNQLTKRCDAEYLVGQHFDHVIENMMCDAILQSKQRNLVINVAVDELWSKFEESRQSIEKQLFRRIRAYEKQLAGLAEVGGAAS